MPTAEELAAKIVGRLGELVGMTLNRDGKGAGIALSMQQQVITGEIHAAERAAAEAMREAAAKEMKDMWECYPQDVFPEPRAGEHGETVDQCSARAFRHAYTVAEGKIRALPLSGGDE